MKLFICGMVRGDRQKIEKNIVPVLKYFDGIVLVIDSRAKEEDIQWLESIKGEGEIIVSKWVNDHAWTMNRFLFTDKMELDDYFVIVDETDRLNEVFCKDLKENCNYWLKNGVGCAWLDHPFVLRYHSGLRVSGSPHWGMMGILGQIISLDRINGYRKENYVFNERDLLTSAFLHPAKYYFYPMVTSNHLQLLYGEHGDKVFIERENERVRFLYFLEKELKVKQSLDNFIDYLLNNKNNYHPYVEKMIEEETNLKDIFRLKVLNQTIHDLIGNRSNWSYFKWKKTGELKQNKYGGWIGLFNRLKLNSNKPME